MTQSDGALLPWRYCPECGSSEIIKINDLGEGSRVCKNCGQEWWIGTDYSDVVAGNLSRLFRLAPAAPDVVIEALRFYATLETYEDEFDGQDPPISMDGGHRATLALATLSTNNAGISSGLVDPDYRAELQTLARQLQAILDGKTTPIEQFIPVLIDNINILLQQTQNEP